MSEEQVTYEVGEQYSGAEVRQIVANALGVVASRQKLAASMQPEAFGGKRKYFKIFGYPVDLSYEDYDLFCRRFGMARRVVEMPALTAWKNSPVVTSLHNDPQGEAVLNAAIRAYEWSPSTRQETLVRSLAVNWRKTLKSHRAELALNFSTPGQAHIEDLLAQEGSAGEDKFAQAVLALDKKIDLWNACANADKYSRKGKYALLFMGVKGDNNLSTEIPEGAKVELAYISVVEQGCVLGTKKEKDAGNPHFRQPVEYKIRFDDEGDGEWVHYTRVIEIENELGLPVLEGIYNHLLDIIKVVGAASESGFKLANKGTVISSTDPQVNLEESSAAIRQQAEAFIHELDDLLLLENLKFEQKGGEIVDPRGLFEVLLTLTQAGVEVPKQLMLGAETGYLAGSQEGINWASYITNRRNKHVEPKIVRKVLNWCIRRQVLIMPANGDVDGYGVSWLSTYEPTELEKMEIATKAATAMSTATGGTPDRIMAPHVFGAMYLGYMPTTYPPAGSVTEL